MPERKNCKTLHSTIKAMKNITSFKRKYDPHFTWNTEKKIQFKPTTPALIYKTKFVNFPIQPMQ